jgi:hypothetical protein
MLKLMRFLCESKVLDVEFIRNNPTITEISLQISKIMLNILVNKEHTLYEFILFLGISPDGTVKSPEDIRSKCPHILFFARVCCLYLYTEEKSALPDKWIELFESEITFSAISELQMLMGYLQSQGDASALIPTIIWKSNANGVMDFKSIVIDEASISLDQLRLGIQSVSNKISDLCIALLGGYRLKEINLGYLDTFRNTEFAKSFESLEMIQEYDRVITSWEWYSKFISQTSWDIPSCNRWIDMCDELAQALLFLIHLIYGQPARATELEKMLVRNDKHLQRSMFIIDQKVCLVQGYHKAQGQSLKRRYIPRFLDKRTSKVFVSYQAFFRKWQE